MNGQVVFRSNINNTIILYHFLFLLGICFFNVIYQIQDFILEVVIYIYMFLLLD